MATQPYERQGRDPLHRPLQIFTLDPAVSRLDGSTTVAKVPYEPLTPGPRGALFEVDNYDGWHHHAYRRVDLDDPAELIRSGRPPSVSDPRFHQQMVYAVCSMVYAAFERALGRHVAWGFGRKLPLNAPMRLRIRPHAFEGRNAYYDPDLGELAFGYFKSDSTVTGRNLPDTYIFTCLSHDIIAHEVAHALLDGLRALFDVPSGRDMLAFHEAFADLIALFQHFTYPQVVSSAIGQVRGELDQAPLLTDLAQQFGQTTAAGAALRTVRDLKADVAYPGEDDEPHALGSILVTAVFEAFMTVYKRKTARYISLATNGTGILPPGNLPHDLQQLLTDTAVRLARQFMTMCIRAIDYCPPIDLTFGEFLRAVITADLDLVPADPWGYREAWIDTFRSRRIYPKHVSNLSEDALRWRPPSEALPPLEGLSFGQLAFDGDPGRPASPEELRRQAEVLGAYIADPANLARFGLARPDDPALRGDTLAPPCVESIRSSRRVGPDGHVAFDLVAEVTQRRIVQRDGRSFAFYGGATIILDPRGAIRFVVSKSVLNEERLAQQADFIKHGGARYWTPAPSGTHLTPEGNLFKLMHT